MKKHPLLATTILSLALAACGKEEPQETAAPAADVAPPPVAMEQAAEGPEVTDRQSGYEIYTAKCISCHGDIGQGVGDNPKLAGLTRADVAARLRDYRDGKTMGAKTAVMAPAAKDLSEDQIASLASYVGE